MGWYKRAVGLAPREMERYDERGGGRGVEVQKGGSESQIQEANSIYLKCRAGMMDHKRWECSEE